MRSIDLLLAVLHVGFIFESYPLPPYTGPLAFSGKVAAGCPSLARHRYMPEYNEHAHQRGAHLPHFGPKRTNYDHRSQ